MFQYLFVLGREPSISTAEIEAVFSVANIKYKIEIKQNNNLVISFDKQINPQELIIQLGGTIKIAKKINSTGNTKEIIIKHIQATQPEGKIQFALTGGDDKRYGLAIKKELKALGRSIRYIEIKNTATILHNKLVERQGDITTIKKLVFITEAIQPIEGLSQRDFGRPGSDSKSGMLPPKLAKIMINLAKIDKHSSTLLDPFCGSGTILSEAAFMGFNNLIGSDISQKAIKDTQTNLEWVKEKESIANLNYKIILSEASGIDKKINKNNIDAIISEPYMGKSLKGNESEKFLIRQAEDLAELYIDSFKTFYKILKKSGVIIFIIPSFHTQDKWINVDCIEQIKKLGLTPVPFSEKYKSLKYWRENQHLARNIWQFKKTI